MQPTVPGSRPAWQLPHNVVLRCAAWCNGKSDRQQQAAPGATGSPTACKQRSGQRQAEPGGH